MLKGIFSLFTSGLIFNPFVLMGVVGGSWCYFTMEPNEIRSLFLKKEGLHPEQVQDFYPTPGTVSTCMYYTNLNPYSMEEIFVAKTMEEKASQRALLQYYLPQNKEIVLKALKKCGRFDLIGTGKNCLVADNKPISNTKQQGKKKSVIRNKHKPKKK